MKGRRPESAFGAFTEHFPPRTGFVVREITERRRLPGAGARGRRPAAEHRAGDTGGERRRPSRPQPSAAPGQRQNTVTPPLIFIYSLRDVLRVGRGGGMTGWEEAVRVGNGVQGF